MYQFENEELKKLSTSLFLERKDYKEIFDTITMSYKSVIVYIIALILAAAALYVPNNNKFSMICLLIDLILITTDYIRHNMKIHKMLKDLFPNDEYPNVIRTLYNFKPEGLYVTIEKPANTENFMIQYNQIKRKQNTMHYTIYYTKNKDQYIIFQRENAPDIYFGFKKRKRHNR